MLFLSVWTCESCVIHCILNSFADLGSGRGPRISWPFATDVGGPAAARCQNRKSIQRRLDLQLLAWHVMRECRLQLLICLVWTVTLHSGLCSRHAGCILDEDAQGSLSGASHP